MPRPERLSITPDRLGAIWPEAQTRIIRSLTTRGADDHTAEDIAQEVALRAMDRGLEFSDVDDFCRWGCTVARNLYVDQARHRLRVVAMTDVPDRAGTADTSVPEQVEHRITLRRTLRGLAMLGESDRSAIVSGVNEDVEDNRRVANRSAVRRHRARNRLLRLVEGLAAFWGLSRGARRTVQVTAVAVAVTTAAVLLPHVSPWYAGDSAAPRSSGQADQESAVRTAAAGASAVREAETIRRAPAAPPAVVAPVAKPPSAAPPGGKDKAPVSPAINRPTSVRAGNDQTGGARVEEYEEDEEHLFCAVPETEYETCVDPLFRL